MARTNAEIDYLLGNAGSGTNPVEVENTIQHTTNAIPTYVNGNAVNIGVSNFKMKRTKTGTNNTKVIEEVHPVTNLGAVFETKRRKYVTLDDDTAGPLGVNKANGLLRLNSSNQIDTRFIPLPSGNNPGLMTSAQNTKLNNLPTNEGLTKKLSDYALKTDISTLFKFKGSVESIGNLYRISTAKVGDVYNVSGADADGDIGSNYVCIENTTSDAQLNVYRWDKLGGSFNMSSYVTTTALEEGYYKKTDVYTKTESDANYVAKENGKALSTNDFTNELKNKLEGIAENANNYSLPTATDTEKGGVTLGFSENQDNGEYAVQMQDHSTNIYVRIPEVSYSATNGFIKPGLVNRGIIDDLFDLSRISDEHTASISNINSKADRKSTVHYSSSEPVVSTLPVGDLWFQLI